MVQSLGSVVQGLLCRVYGPWFTVLGLVRGYRVKGPSSMVQGLFLGSMIYGL